MGGKRSRAKDSASFQSLTFTQFHSYFSFACYNIFIGFVHSTCYTNFLYLILLNVVHLWICSSYDGVHIHYFTIGMFICLYDCSHVQINVCLQFYRHTFFLLLKFFVMSNCFLNIFILLDSQTLTFSNMMLILFLCTLDVYIGNWYLHFCDGDEIKWMRCHVSLVM
jgi:hypothetical protein